MRQATPFSGNRGWIVWQIDTNGRAIVRNRSSWNVLLFDTEDEARTYGRMNVFDAYEVEFIDTTTERN